MKYNDIKLKDLEFQRLNEELNRVTFDLEKQKTINENNLCAWKDNVAGLNREIEALEDQLILVNSQLSLYRDVYGATCPNDTDGDGNCGRRLCPVCSPDVWMND